MLQIGVSGHELTARERDWLQHDACAGVVLFARNFASRSQVAELVQAIRETAPRPQLICVDQEGGRVQRFKDGYTLLPALQGFDALYREDADSALALAREHAWLMASEIRATGVDMSFAPVIDLGRGNRAIGNRAFSPDPAIVAAFARTYVAGMHEAGMPATLKHFPGHGSIPEDTHFDIATDDRSLDEMRATDLVPFVAGIQAGAEAVMMAHITYPQVAPEPAGYSPRWIKDILRGEMQFRGVVFSDDIGMAAAHSAGGVKARIDAHLDAGCEVVLVCHPQMVDEALRAMDGRTPDAGALACLHGRDATHWDALLAGGRRGNVQARLASVRESSVDAGATSGAINVGDAA